jgi:hypothetical protein
MRAISTARKLIKADPLSPPAVVMADLVLALETDANYPLANIYKLNYKDFELAIEIIKDWRIDRYYAGKGKLIDIAVQSGELRSPSE